MLVDAEVMQSVLRDLRGRFEAKSMRVENELPTDLVVYADPSLLQVVYENLLGNAVKYGREEGLVRVWAKQEGAYVELHVWNDGPGVPADQMAALPQVLGCTSQWRMGLARLVCSARRANTGIFGWKASMGGIDPLRSLDPVLPGRNPMVSFEGIWGKGIMLLARSEVRQGRRPSRRPKQRSAEKHNTGY